MFVCPGSESMLWASNSLTAVAAGCVFRDVHFRGPLGTPSLAACRTWLFQPQLLCDLGTAMKTTFHKMPG